MNNCRLDCAENCYLSWQSQKSSPPSTAITTSSLSLGATRHITGVTKEIVRVKIGEEKEGVCEGKGGIKQLGFQLLTLQFCSKMNLLPVGDLLKPSLPASFGLYKGINQGFTRTSPDTLTTSHTSTRQKTKSTAGVKCSGQQHF